MTDIPGRREMRADNIELAELIYMADVYRKRRFFHEATDLLTQALSATDGVSKASPEHTTQAIVQYSLAKVYEQQGNDFFARELYQQALNDWLGGKALSPINQLWPFRSVNSLERACQQLIRFVEQRSDIQNLPLPSVPHTERWLKAG